MSRAVTALNGASFDGLVQVEEVGLQGMITLRGDLSAAAVKKAAKAASGVAMPAVGRQVGDGATGLCWMSPDEALVLCPYDQVSQTLDKMHKALGKAHALAVDVSDARAVFRLSGPQVREVIAKICPVDMAPGSFEPGMFRRTRMAQVPAAFWMPDENTVQIIVFRSVAKYVFDLLCTSARPGSSVGIF